MIAFLRKQLLRVAGIRIFRPVHQIFDALDSAFFGVHETALSGPHIRDGIDMKRYMIFVVIALAPAALSSIWHYGWNALGLILVSYAAGGVVEVLFAVIRKKHIEEGFLVTGLIFPLTLPPGSPLWLAALGMLFGTFFGKELFGGTGRNIFNPALVGRLFVTISFPGIMTAKYINPLTDAVSAATPLVAYKSTQAIHGFTELLMGTAAGSMGETFRIGIIAGGLLLILLRISNWRLPVFYLGTVAVLSALGHRFIGPAVAPPLFQILSGGLLFGAFFMATDPVTSPYTQEGRIIAGIFCGLMTLLIRSFSGFVEGVMFSIVLMNAFAPLIDHMVLQVKYRRPA